VRIKATTFADGCKIMLFLYYYFVVVLFLWKVLAKLIENNTVFFPTK